ncbi:hypothetical protein Tco_1066610 [Tanacetum coccineum]|uniref:DUF4216 domain-containing protein n=1 Tax=Tanacetum coccineum TaxID=301880 RepID=A0ABQ5HCM4_9ASTR
MLWKDRADMRIFCYNVTALLHVKSRGISLSTEGQDGLEDVKKYRRLTLKGHFTAKIVQWAHSPQGQHEEEDEEKAKCSRDESTSMIKELGSNDHLEYIELNYSGKIRVVLFRGEWVDINRGCKKDKFGATLVNFSHLSHSGANLLDDTFVFGSQVDKVFYCEDPRNKGWSVVRHIKVKDVFDMGSVNASHLHRIGDDGEDVTSDMEHDGTDDEEDDVE